MAGSESPARRGDFVEEMKSAVQIVTPAVQPSGRKRSCAIPGWKSLLLMFSMLLIGTLTAIGHAQVYQFLDGRSIEEVPISQAWIIRAGIGFAFLFKTVLVVAVGTVFCQVFWFMIRRDALQVGTIDACFGVLQNPLHVFNRELWKKRLALIILATIAWCIPLAAIFSPGTLTVVTTAYTQVLLAQVPIVTNLYGDVGIVKVGSDGGYIGASDQFTRFVYRIFTSSEVIPWPSPCGTNCSYNATFFGPAYNCVTALNATLALQNLQDVTSESATLGPSGCLYYAEDVPGNMTTQGLWFEYTSNNLTVIQCQLHNTTYDIAVQFLNNQLNVSTELTYHEQLNNNLSGLVATDVFSDLNATNWALVNYFTVSETLIGLLEGCAIENSVYGSIDYGGSRIELSTLVDDLPFTIGFPDDFRQSIVDLLANITLSITSFVDQPLLPSISGDVVNPVAVYTPVNATVVTYPARYAYSASALWEIYGITLGCTAATIIIGTYLLLRNGVDADMSFAQILVTTRNKTLDELCAGVGLGGENISKTIRKTKLKFGELKGEPSHVCFGKEAEISPLKKNGYTGISNPSIE